jgi:hypothetical protein
MTAAIMELSYELSARERESIQAKVDMLSLARKGVSLAAFNKPFWRVVIVLFLGFEVIRWLVGLLPSVLAGEVELSSFGEIFGLLLGLFLTWIVVDSLRYLVTDILRWLGAERIWRKGLHWGEHHLAVTPEKLSLRLADYESEYRWPAFTGFHKTKDMLLLTVTPWSAVAVPRRAFQSPAEESAFCDFVEARIGAAT